MVANIIQDRIDKLIKHPNFLLLVNSIRRKDKAGVDLQVFTLNGEGFSEHDIMLAIKVLDDRRKLSK